MSLELALLLALLGGLLALGSFAWRRRRNATNRVAPGPTQEVDVVINGRYQPDVVVVRQGIPVKLNFFRKEDNPCSEWVIFSEFNVRRRLPAHKNTAVAFVPTKEGEFLFTCQRGMYRGKLVVKKEAPGSRGTSWR